MKTRYHYTSIEQLRSKTVSNTRYWPGYGTTGPLIHCWWKWTQNGTATLENHLVVSYKTTHTLTGNCVPWYLPKGVKNLFHMKNLHVGVDSTFIHNVKIWTPPSVGGLINCGTPR